MDLSLIYLAPIHVMSNLILTHGHTVNGLGKRSTTFTTKLLLIVPPGARWSLTGPGLVRLTEDSTVTEAEHLTAINTPHLRTPALNYPDLTLASNVVLGDLFTEGSTRHDRHTLLFHIIQNLLCLVWIPITGILGVTKYCTNESLDTPIL